MDDLRFEWDENKNSINKIKHKISFEEAKTVFEDVEALIIDDPDHSQEEGVLSFLDLVQEQICWSFVIVTDIAIPL